MVLRYAILKAAWAMVEDKIMDVEDIDKVISAGLGMRYAFMGALETAHLNDEGMKSYIERSVQITKFLTFSIALVVHLILFKI